MDDGFSPLFRATTHVEEFNGIRRDGFFLSRHKILVVVEAGEKTKTKKKKKKKKLGRTWRTNRSNYQRRSVIQQAESCPRWKKFLEPGSRCFAINAAIKYEGEKGKIDSILAFHRYIHPAAYTDGNRWKILDSKKIRKLETRLIILTTERKTDWQGTILIDTFELIFKTKLFPKHEKLVQFSNYPYNLYLFKILRLNWLPDHVNLILTFYHHVIIFNLFLI